MQIVRAFIPWGMLINRMDPSNSLYSTMYLQRCMLLVLLVSSQQCNVDKNNVLINSGSSTITISKNESVYLVYYMTSGVNGSTLVYSTPIENSLHLTYDSDFKVNLKNMTLVDGIGQVKLSPILQKMLKPINSCKPILPVRICLDFSTERLVMKTAVGILGILLLASNGTTCRAIIQKVSSDILRPEFTRRFSRTRSPVSGGEEDNSSSLEETSD